MKSVKVSDSSYEYIRNTAFHQRKTHQEVIDNLVQAKEILERAKFLKEHPDQPLVPDGLEDMVNTAKENNKRINESATKQAELYSGKSPDKKGNMEFEI